MSVTLRAGAAMVDVTPAAGTHLGGTWGTLRAAETITERLHARALVFQQGDRKLCIIQPDLEIIVEPYTSRIREAVSAGCGIAPDAIMVHLPQPHSTPPVGNFLIDRDFPHIPPEHEYLRGAQSAYCDYAVGKMIEAAILAHENLQPVQIAAGSAARDDLAFNRRGVLRDGTVGMPWLYSQRDKPLGATEYRCLEGPMDPEVGVFCVRNRDMDMVAMLLHYTCHPVNVFARVLHTVSPDWPGAWAEEMQARFGTGCVPLVLNGCCGNINPWPAFQADFTPDHRRMGRELAETSRKVIETLRFSDTAVLDWKVRHLKLPLKQADPADREAAERLLTAHPAPQWQADNPKQVTWEWMDAAMLMSVELERERTGGTCDYEIQVLRVGDVAFVGLPGEPFVEAQLAIKIGSPTYPTYVAHGTTDYAGYIAPLASYARGGHEIRTTPAKWAKLEPGALEQIQQAAIEVLEEVFTSEA
jgi:neutral ceramidase